MSINLTTIKYRKSGEEDNIKIMLGHVPHQNNTEPMKKNEQYDVKIKGSALWLEIMELLNLDDSIFEENGITPFTMKTTDEFITWLAEEDIAYVDVWISAISETGTMDRWHDDGIDGVPMWTPFGSDGWVVRREAN